MFSFNNFDENFSKAHLQPFNQYTTQIYRTGSVELDPTSLIGGFHDDKSSNQPISKTFRTIRKHFTRTTNNEGEINNITEEIQRNFPKQTVTTVTIKRTLPNNQSLSSFDNDLQTNSFDFFKDKFPKQQYHQTTTTNNQGLSTTYTTYHTRTVTVHSNSGALRFFFSFVLFYERACCLF
jgi:hypothetical protein